VVLALMGMSLDDLPTFLRWRDQQIRPDVEPGDFEGAAAIRSRTSHEITEYFEALIDEKRRNPDDRLMTRIVNASIDGRTLSREELLGICHLLLLGGLDTVTATLDCMISWLAEHPIERQKIVDDPGLVPTAVEELLRHQTPVMIVPRILKQDVTVSGVDLKAGDGVTVVLGAANSDGDEFADPTSVDLTREPNKHVAFGAGNHLCLGAHLARLELRVALEEFHRRIPDYRIADGVELHFSPGIRQADHLPLVWDV
jgi:cytochrome P450